MQFKYIEILYFLPLLIIPILVHLFQLQKFTKTPFTNVAFLRKIVQQTRNSSRLKKWLLLIIRLFLLAFIILAFSQPYFNAKSSLKKKVVFIYLDNSLSMSFKGRKGNLLAVSKQEIIDNISENNFYSLLTNSHFYKEITSAELKNILLKVKKTTKKLSIKDVLLKINSLNKNKTKTLDSNILISDFQNTTKKVFTNVTSNLSLIQHSIIPKSNLSIDSVFTQSKNKSNFTLQIVIKNQGDKKTNIPIAIFNHTKLIGKQSFSIRGNTTKTIVFDIQNKQNFLGKIFLNFTDAFSFDNTFYFTLNLTKKITVLSIGKSSKFLSKIYTKNNFYFTSSTVQNINYNSIPKQQLIILNEIKNIPFPLQKSLIRFLKKGGHIVMIPNESLNINNYKHFFTNLELRQILQKNEHPLKITQINYNHPLFKGVFSKEAQNFQYPTTKVHYLTAFKNSSNIISFENNRGFIEQVNAHKSKFYWVSSPLNLINSNFINSPLVVPVFYNFGLQSVHFSKLFYRIGVENKIDVTTQLKKETVLYIKNNNSHFIPLQEIHQNKVVLTTKEQPLLAKNYYITKKKDTLQFVAFNNPKEESTLQFLKIHPLAKNKKNISFSTSVKGVFQKIKQKNKVQWLWKWFLSLAIVSLLLEILILKFFKP